MSRTNKKQLPEKVPDYTTNWDFEIAKFDAKERRRKMLRDLDEVLGRRRANLDSREMQQEML